MDVNFADQLAVLTEVNAGLLSRLGYHKEVLASEKKPNVLVAPEFDRVRKVLLKAYPNAANVGAQDKFYEEFQKQVDTIYKDTEPVFQSCLEVLSFLDEATRCFEDALLTRQMDFKFDKNTRLMAEFMDLFVGHIQIQLYLGSSSDIKLSLCVYGQAYLQKHGKADPNFVKLTTALQRMFDSPWRKIQEEMQNFSIPIANILSSLYMPYINGFTCETLRTNAVLNPVAEAMTLAMPSHKPIYQELLYLDRMHFWVIYGLLACPTQFSRSEIMELFKLVARSGYQIQIYRNEVFNYHDEIERLFSWFPNKTVPTKFDKDVKPKRIMGDVAKSAVISAGLAHRERRSFIVGELQNMLHTFRECPGLVAPKFPMVLAGLSMARAEIIWYFHHLQRKIPSRVKSKSHIKESYEAPQISLVVHLLQELSKFILKHGLVIQKYYLEYLKGADFSEMQRHIDAVVQSTTGLNPQIAQALQDILAIVNGADPDSPDGWTFESLRLTWDRLSAIFTSSTGANIRKMPGAEPLLKRMSTVVRHTAYIDKLPELLCEFVDLKDLWWYRHQLFGAKPGAQEFLKCIYGRNSQPLYAVSMASVLQSAGNNVSKFCPEITESLGEAMIKEAETQLEVVARSILSLLEPCCQQLQRYDQQIAPIEAAHRLHRQQEKRKAAGKGAVNHVPEPTAGFESRPQSRGAIRDLVEKERNLVELCSAVSNSEPIVVFNRCFHPCLFVKEKLQWALQDHMRKALKPSSGTAAIERPSVFLEKIVRFIRCCQRGLIHLDIDLHTMARQVLLQETFDTKVSTVGEVLLSAQRAESDPNSIVSKLADFYVALVEQHVSSTVLAGGSGIICYSSFRQAFVRYPVPGQKGVLPMHAELFTAPAELRALCTLIGPQGVRVIDSRLLSVIEKRVAQIKIILAADRQPLSELRNEYLKHPQWYTICQKMTHLDDLMEHSVRVGIALYMRQLLRQALGQVSAECVPHVKEVIRLAYHQYPENTYGQKEFEPLDVVADDVGLSVGAADHSLKTVLSSLKVNADDSRLWDLLPFAYGAVLTCNGWKKADYIAHLDAYMNNAHVMAFTIQKLILCFQSNIVTQPLGGSPIEISLQEYLRCSSFILLRMKLMESSEFREFPLRAMFVFMEKFIEGSEHLERSMLQNCLPYALLHAAYVDMSLGRNRASDEAASSKALFGTAAAIEESREQAVTVTT